VSLIYVSYLSFLYSVMANQNTRCPITNGKTISINHPFINLHPNTPPIFFMNHFIENHLHKLVFNKQQ
jgi:hypothetical protein